MKLVSRHKAIPGVMEAEWRMEGAMAMGEKVNEEGIGNLNQRGE